MVRFLLHSYGEFDRRHPLSPVVWPHFDIVFVHEGKLRLQWEENVPVQLGRHEGVLIFPYTPFEGEALTRVVRASVQHFSLEEGDGADPILARLVRRRKEVWHFSSRNSPGLPLDIERALQLAARPASAYVHALRRAQLQLIVGEIGIGRHTDRRRAAEIPFQLREALEWAREHLAGASIAMLAARTEYSASHFRALFEKHLGSSPGKYLRRLRINEAKRLLRETRLPLKRIAAELGFADAVSFHRSFGSLTGHTPASYRRRYAPRG